MNALALHLGRQDFLCPKFSQFKILWDCYVYTSTHVIPEATLGLHIALVADPDQ